MNTTPLVRTGAIAIIGRPNVGKSTLINRLAGVKVCIVSNKPQTTRHRIRGILTCPVGADDCQFIFVDTPGFQLQHKNALNRAMNRNIAQSLPEVDAVILVVEAGRWQTAEDDLLGMLPPQLPVVLVINKIDRIRDKNTLLPIIAQCASKHDFAAIVPVSAESGQGSDHLLTALAPLLPANAHIFAADDFTDRPERFLAAELLREKLFRQLGEELPYGLAVDIEKFEQEGELRRIYAAILVDRAAHKAIIIGKNGEQLKRISTAARRDMETLFGGKVWLETWVKVKSGWADDERILRSLGVEE